MEDYRCTKYCTPFYGVLSKRNEFKKTFEKKHSHCVYHYNILSKKDSEDKPKFIEIFGKKCPYCGTSLSIIGIDMFEIDHFIPKESFDEKDYAIADCIDNLVPACQLCNRKKSNYLYDNNQIIDVENGISKVFCRDNNYYIRINDEYKNDKKIMLFYEQMNFGSQMRRLDFLLMCIEGLAKKQTLYKKDLYYVFSMLLSKRNEISSYIK